MAELTTDAWQDDMASDPPNLTRRPTCRALQNLNSNTFLKPLVDDLLCLWRGMPILPDGNTARVALLAVAADMPATRKLTGFLSHKANQGCN